MKKNFESEQARLMKNQRIAQTKRETIERRGLKNCKTFHLKIDGKKNQESLKELDELFNQAKWLRNYLISLKSLSNYDNSIKFVDVHTPWGVEKRELTLGSQLKQGIYKQVKSDIKSLAISKEKNHQIGRLKFTRKVNSIDLPQGNNTYRFNEKMTRVKIQKLKQWYKVYGAHQFSKLSEVEIANGKLLRKADGFYLAVTVYYSPEKKNLSDLKRSLGVDFGLRTNFTLSDGREFNFRIEETDRLKRLQRKLRRQKRGSINRYKTQQLIRKEYLKIHRRKEDTAAKWVKNILDEAQVVYYQDDNFNSWKKGMFNGGKVIQHSILGRVKERMKNNPRFLKVDRFAPTTRTCVCGVKNSKLTLSDLWFWCDSCGYTAPRDVHAASMMEHFYTPVDCGGAPVERLVGVSMKQETDNFFTEVSKCLV